MFFGIGREYKVFLKSMQTILQDLLCPDTAKIKAAELALENFKKSAFMQCFSELVQGLQVPSLQEMSALLL